MYVFEFLWILLLVTATIKHKSLMNTWYGKNSKYKETSSDIFLMFSQSITATLLRIIVIDGYRQAIVYANELLGVQSAANSCDIVKIRKIVTFVIVSIAILLFLSFQLVHSIYFWNPKPMPNNPRYNAYLGCPKKVNGNIKIDNFKWFCKTKDFRAIVSVPHYGQINPDVGLYIVINGYIAVLTLMICVMYILICPKHSSKSLWKVLLFYIVYGFIQLIISVTASYEVIRMAKKERDTSLFIINSAINNKLLFIATIYTYVRSALNTVESTEMESDEEGQPGPKVSVLEIPTSNTIYN